MQITAFDLASRFIGIKETAGVASNPMILGMLKLDGEWPQDDDVPWCSAFANYVCWLLRLPRSKSLAARSWLNIGVGIDISQADPGSDIVILKRGEGVQPGPEVVNAPGHVGFFAGYDEKNQLVEVLAGNQGDSVSIARFPVSKILSIRRILND